MFDRRLEVAGHPRGQLEPVRISVLYPLLFLLQTRERGTGIRSQRRDGHQADENEAVRISNCGAQFVDPAGGSGSDSMTLAIGHRHGEKGQDKSNAPS